MLPPYSIYYASTFFIITNGGLNMAKINYALLKERTCVYCGVEYKPKGPAQNSCQTCRNHILNIEGQVRRDMIRYEKFGTYESIGKGGSNKRGPEHKQYKDGIGFFNSVLSKAVKTRRYCERCNKDLQGLSSGFVCAHHKDHDRSNNVIDNIELLCKSCHQKEHEVHKNFKKCLEGSTTIPKREYTQVSGSGETVSNDSMI